jgi:peptide/nickel transport system ATP-binding protein
MYLAPRPLLEIRHLSISYSSSSEILRAVRDISLQVYEGETLALAGETGSGKSTLALAVLGLLDPQAYVESGEISYEGCSLQSLKKRDWKEIRGRKIGIIFQDARSTLNPVLTVENHLIETLRAHQPLTKKKAQARALELLQEVGIPKGHEKLHPFELSGGICQRVGIALAICNNPQLLIADEPTSSLDSTIQAQILDLLLLMKQRYGLALLWISHDLALISHVADRISIMYHGRIVESGLTEEVFAFPAHPYTQSLIQCLVGLQHHHETQPLMPIPGVIPIPGRDLQGCAFAPRCGNSKPECLRMIPVGREVSNSHWVACIHDFGDKEWEPDEGAKG